jgi:hypothetical protein
VQLTKSEGHKKKYERERVEVKTRNRNSSSCLDNQLFQELLGPIRLSLEEVVHSAHKFRGTLFLQLRSDTIPLIKYYYYHYVKFFIIKLLNFVGSFSSNFANVNEP